LDDPIGVKHPADRDQQFRRIRFPSPVPREVLRNLFPDEFSLDEFANVFTVQIFADNLLDQLFSFGRISDRKKFRVLRPAQFARWRAFWVEQVELTHAFKIRQRKSRAALTGEVSGKLLEEAGAVGSLERAPS
jgi:hypothetical protein